MAPLFARVVADFKADVGQVLSATVIEQLCEDLGHEYRQRILDPAQFHRCSSLAPDRPTRNAAAETGGLAAPPRPS